MTGTALVTNASDFAGQPAVDALRKAGLRVFVHDATFTDPRVWEAYAASRPGIERIAAASPADLVAKAWEKAGRIDAVVSNDHFPAVHAPIETASLASLEETFQVLVARPFALLQAAIPRLKAQGGGNVVMITSNRNRLQQSGGAIPDIARAGVNALMRSLAIELAADDIAVNAVAPNFLYSEAYYPRAVFIDDPAGRAYVEHNVPARRLGKPEEIGEVILFLATTRARFLTGAMIDFSGGWPAAAPRPG